MAWERAVGFDQQAGWREVAERWNRRISLFTALAIGLVSFLACWAVAIKFGSWFGVFLGWWPALMIGSFAALAGRADLADGAAPGSDRFDVRRPRGAEFDSRLRGQPVGARRARGRCRTKS